MLVLIAFVCQQKNLVSMICQDCNWCVPHFPLSGMQSDGYVCSHPPNEGNSLFVDLSDSCHLNIK